MAGNGCRGRKTYSGSLRNAMVGLLPPEVLALLPEDGKTRWTTLLLVLCAILTSWSGAGTLAERFENARGCLLRWYPGRRRPGGSYQGFIAALRSRSGWLARQVGRCYRGQVRELAESRGNWLVGGWAAFGVDSTKHDAPMTLVNETALGCASKAKSWPQMVLTTLFHLGSGLPWSFVRAGARASERRHLLALLCTLPKQALILADAGFTGYAFWRKIIDSERSFLIRVGSNVRLIRDLGLAVRTDAAAGLAWVWPAGEQKRRAKPLLLRLIPLTDHRNRTMYLLTNVLEHQRLDDHLAARLYPMRWGVEVMYRALKHTLARRKLLSDSPRNVRVELTWAMIGLWTLLLIKAKRAKFNTDQGTAATLRVIRKAMTAAQSFDFQKAVTRLKPDVYERRGSKKARHWPHRKRPKPPGVPKARSATETEIMLAIELERLDPAA
jgi:hypothetical protein